MTDTVPAPNPPNVTTEFVERETGHLRELMLSEIKNERDTCTEKFAAVDEQLRLVERQRVEQKKDATDTRLETKADTTKALEAALVAAKDQNTAQAVAFTKEFAKTEKNTDEKIAAMGVTFGSQIVGMQANIDDLKAGLGEIKNVKVGNTEAKAAMYALVGFLVSLIVLGGFVAAVWPA